MWTKVGYAVSNNCQYLKVNADCTFLVVDDDADARFLTRHALEKGFPGATIIECENPQAALHSAADRHVDGVITDHHMATEDGVALIRDLRAQGVHCAIVMVTASSDPTVHRRAYEAGAAHVFANGDYDFVSFFRTELSDKCARR